MALQAVIVLQRPQDCTVESVVHVELLDVLCIQVVHMIRYDASAMRSQSSNRAVIGKSANNAYWQ